MLGQTDRRRQSAGGPRPNQRECHTNLLRTFPSTGYRIYQSIYAEIVNRILHSAAFVVKGSSRVLWAMVT